MRASHLIAAAIVASVATKAIAQDLGSITRGVVRTAARDVAERVTGPSTARSKARASKSPPASASAPSGSAPFDSVAQSEGGIVVAEDMPVISSDGARVAVVKHTSTGGTAYAADKTFFTADPYYRLRRIYGREATVAGGAVRLKMTAAQYRARNQNPD